MVNFMSYEFYRSYKRKKKHKREIGSYSVTCINFSKPSQNALNPLTCQALCEHNQNNVALKPLGSQGSSPCLGSLARTTVPLGLDPALGWLPSPSPPVSHHNRSPVTAPRSVPSAAHLCGLFGTSALCKLPLLRQCVFRPFNRYLFLRTSNVQAWGWRPGIH